MKRVVFSAVILLTSATAFAANAEQGRRLVTQAHCQSQSTDHPDGTSDEIRVCHTDSDGTR